MSATATGDIDVTMDDQLRINKFSRLNQTYEELEGEILQMKVGRSGETCPRRCYSFAYGGFLTLGEAEAV